MTSIEKEVKEEFSKSGPRSKIPIKNVDYPVQIEYEFCKWLSYLNEEEKLTKEYLFSKFVDELTVEELEKIIEFKKEENYYKLIEKYTYHTDICSEEEYLLACKFISSQSLFGLIKKKLTPEEFNYANEKAKEVIRSSSMNEMETYLEIFNTRIEPYNYERLDMIEAYVIHQIMDAYHKSCIRDQYNKIKDDVENHKVKRKKRPTTMMKMFTQKKD